MWAVSAVSADSNLCKEFRKEFEFIHNYAAGQRGRASGSETAAAWRARWKNQLFVGQHQNRNRDGRSRARQTKQREREGDARKSECVRARDNEDGRGRVRRLSTPWALNFMNASAKNWAKRNANNAEKGVMERTQPKQRNIIRAL